MACLDDNAVSAYVARRLGDDELVAIVEHLASCDACLTLTCAVAGTGGGAPEATRIGRYTVVEKLGQGMMRELGIARTNVSSVLRLIESQLEITLSSFDNPQVEP